MTAMRLTDDAIRAALTPPAEVRAPAGLALGVFAAIEGTPQRRPLVPWLAPSPRTRLVLRLVVVGLLVLGAAVALLIAGSRRPAPVTLPTVTTYHGGPDRAGLMPGPGPAGLPRIEWQHQVAGPLGAWSPVVADGAVYVDDESGAVTALDEVTGSQRWQVTVGAAINGGLSVSGHVLVVCDDAGLVHALDTGSGAELWRHATGARVHTAAAIADGTAWLGSFDGRLYALDLATGREVWPTVATAGPVSRAIAMAGGVLYAGSGGATLADPGSLAAYDAATGALRWSAPLSVGNATTPTVADGLVFVGDGLDTSSPTTHSLRAFDAATGAAAWPSPFASPNGKNVLIGAVAQGLVFVTAVDGNLYALDERTGALAWTLPIGSSQSPSAGIVGGTLYVTSDDRTIRAVDIATHAVLWSVAVKGAPGSPAIVDGRILVGTNLGLVVSVTGSDAVGSRGLVPGGSATP